MIPSADSMLPTKSFMGHSPSEMVSNISWRMLSEYLLFAILLENSGIVALSSQELCLSKVCTGCIAGSLSCQEGGLIRLPDTLSPDIQSMILIGHRFDNNVLSKANFSNYSQQNAQLQRLTLRNCGIERLLPGALQNLRYLTQLDFSQNRLQIIESHTFVGLRLELLRLDENHGLHLAPGAFREASIVSLSMNQCGLRSLTYSDLAPLLQNNALTNLHLSGNKLMTLESRLEPVFLGLRSLSIEQNPFICDCQTRWLADLLQKRSLRRQPRELKKFAAENGLLSDPLSGESEFGIRSTPLDGDLLKPVCRSPERLSGRPIEALTHRDFYCELPQLKSLEIDLSHSDEAVIPHQEAQIVDNSIQQRKPHLKVILRCEVKGSPELQLSWYRRSSTKMLADLGLHTGDEQLVHLPFSKATKPGVVEIHLSQPPQFLESNVQTSVRVRSNPMEQFICMASDLSGNTSAEVRLRWPTTDSHAALINTQQEPQVSHSNNYPAAETVHSDKQPDVKMDSKIPSTQADSGLRSDWYLLTGEDPNGFWLQKQFSAVQMIGAVVGTFTTTLLLFIFGCCLLKAHRFQQSCSRPKILLQHTSDYQHSSPHCKYTSPPSYSIPPTHSNASFLYPNTSGNSTDTQTSFGTQLPYHSTPITQATEVGTAATEGANSGKLLHYTTYEPITMTDISHTTTYSDSQMYDLPQFPVTLSPPRVPLPPLPGGPGQPATVSNHTMETRSPYYVSTLSGPVTEQSVLRNGTVFSPLFVHNSDNVSAAISMAATLNRLKNSPLIPTGQFQMNPNGSFSQQQLVAAAAAQNQLFNFVNHPSAMVTPPAGLLASDMN
ncbi:hypothetical protein EG68_04766 [Paragonimus skrjabini miyazakii]|uniref:Ig-like domain-containing protein n=1 Tax=Paragonimus skrjabini miyazakii TaxID=59628 RepID=A0A8S9YTC0_9TREM|nr:hypothetical protein EG68_04766 [Paragonimus skrjabini miyazakii]